METYHFFVTVEADDKISQRGLSALLSALHDNVFAALVEVGRRYKVTNVVAVTTTQLEERGEIGWKKWKEDETCLES